MPDWRVLNAKRTRGATVTRQQWVAPSETWDHEHCVGCWTKFMDEGLHKTLAAGYTTADDCWICDECFDALKDEMGWKLA